MEEPKKARRIAGYVADYVVFDLETTGIRLTSDDIIEISAIKVRDGQVAAEFSELVNPKRRIPQSATEVNGITDEMVADARTLKEVLADFLFFIGDDVLVGHNIQSFDLKFLNQAVEYYYGTILTNDYIDTLFTARNCLPELNHHRLSDVAEYFHISTEGAHRALNDCVMNQKCYEELGKLSTAIPIVICPKCGCEMVKRSGKFGEFYGCSNYPVCRQTKKIREK